MVERIRQLLHDKQLTPTQFADAIGIARPIVSHILSGRNKPSLEVVMKILAAFADLSMPWLLNGSGPMWALETAAPAASPVAAAPTATALPVAPAVASTATNSTVPVPAPWQAETGSEAENASLKASRPQPEQPSANAASSATPPKRPTPKALPPLRRFQATRPGQTKEAVAETRPEMLPDALEAAAPPIPALTPVATPVAPMPTPVPSPATPAPTQPNNEAAPVPADAAAFLLQPGKAIRRIVIFYQDGSFADYQPE